VSGRMVTRTLRAPASRADTDLHSGRLPANPVHAAGRAAMVGAQQTMVVRPRPAYGPWGQYARLAQ
jgi:hypothetical protein